MPPHRTGVVWGAFALVHATMAVLGVTVVPAEAFHDVDLYRWWAHLALVLDVPPVVAEPWVYPAGALVPVLLPGLVTTVSTPGYAVAWCVLVTVLDAVAVAYLLRRAPAGHRAALWWLAFLALLGPVWLGRLDGVVAPLVVVALAAAARSPVLASALLTFGAWVKVAPGALVLPVLAAARRPLHQVVLPALLVSVAVAGTVLALGSGDRVLSFLGTQDGRGLQTESVTATGWVLASLARDDVTIELHETLITWEVRGPGTAAAAAVLDVLLPLAVLAVGALLVVARSRGRATTALLPGAVVLAVLLVVTNKVGSPQFLAWIGAAVAALVAGGGTSRTRRTLGGTALAAAGFTQLVFPWGYAGLLQGDVVVTAALVVRNGLLVALLVQATLLLRAAVVGREPVEEPAAQR